MTTTSAPDPGAASPRAPEPVAGRPVASTALMDVETEVSDVLARRPRFRSPDWQRALTATLVLGATLFVVWNLRPWVWFVDSTPTGGDLGAHVWAPAFLRDSLLPDLRLTGWSPDWYAGFPAFTFYMVVPSLLIVIVNVGLDVPIGVFTLVATALLGHEWARRSGFAIGARMLAAAGGVFVGVALRAIDDATYDPPGMTAFVVPAGTVDIVLGAIVLPVLVAGLAWTHLERRPTLRLPAAVGLGVVTLLCVPVPYGIAIKLVVIAGLVTLPVSAYLMGRLAGLVFPGPGLLAVGTLPFIFDRSYNIYGGNLMSTMAGEFAYSLGLTFAVLTVGVVAQGLDTGRHRVLGGFLLAVTGLTHLFSAFFALTAIAGLLVVRMGRSQLRHTAVVGSLAAALSAWWVLPFWWNSDLLNDMGWGKERRYVSALWSRTEFDYGFLTNDPPLQLFVVLAIVGAALSAFRRVRMGMTLTFVALAFAFAFVILPEGRLWNVRLLPFYYLSVYLLAALGVGEIARLAGAAAGWRPGGVAGRRVVFGAGAVAFVFLAVIVVMLGRPLRSLPGGSLNDEGAYEWGPLSTREFNLGGFWVEYNFEGYEDKDPSDVGGGTEEYRDLVATMARVGEEFGCGRSLWEYESGRLGTYGTTMAPMLLPHWTNGCIGSMEGLYFEASATTPFHFLLQSELSTAPSRAQRDLDYSSLDVSAGVDHLQLMGVRYYLAFSQAAIQQARAEPELTEIASSGPWVVFLVEDSDLVAGLDHLPVVFTDVDHGWRSVGASQDEWLEPAYEFWVDSENLAFRAQSGPEDWPRAGSDESAPKVAVEPAEVMSTRWTDRSIAFTVDEIGTPVLVRTSFFPNWKVEGADGPYRVTPNLMVVVPTDTQVELTYGRSPIELVAMLITLLGVVAAVVIARRPTREPDDPWWDFGPREPRFDVAEVIDDVVSWRRITPLGDDRTMNRGNGDFPR